MNYSEIADQFRELSEKELSSLNDIKEVESQIPRMDSLIAARLYDLSGLLLGPQTPSGFANSAEIAEYARKFKDWENLKADRALEKEHLKDLQKKVDILAQSVKSEKASILVCKLNPGKASQILGLARDLVSFYEEIGQPTEIELVEFLAEKL
jgi:hypothetical protein